jgi:hypothetical protein
MVLPVMNGQSVAIAIEPTTLNQCINQFVGIASPLEEHGDTL